MMLALKYKPNVPNFINFVRKLTDQKVWYLTRV